MDFWRDQIEYKIFIFSINVHVFLNACMSADDNVIIDTGIKATLPETIDAYLNTNLSSDEPGVSILVRKNGELIYKNVKDLLINQIVPQSVMKQDLD